MLSCPDCHGDIPSDVTACRACGWVLQSIEGIPILLSTTDQKSPLFKDYRANYDLIAEVDLQDSIMNVSYKRAMATNVLRALGNLNGKRICDIGTGRGELLEEILQHNRPESLLTVDIAVSYLLAQHRPDISSAIANAENLPYRDEFDLILAIDVIEHLTNPGAFLYSANRALRQSGKIVIRTPYLENPMQYAPQMGCPYSLVHLRTFDRSIMRVYLDSAGFQICSMRLDGFHPRNLRRILTRRRSKLDRLINRMFSRLYPDPIAITLERPYIARLFCRPIEILTIAKKIRDLPAPSTPRSIPAKAVDRSEAVTRRLGQAMRRGPTTTDLAADQCSPESV